MALRYDGLSFSRARGLHTCVCQIHEILLLTQFDIWKFAVYFTVTASSVSKIEKEWARDIESGPISIYVNRKVIFLSDRSNTFLQVQYLFLLTVLRKLSCLRRYWLNKKHARFTVMIFSFWWGISVKKCAFQITHTHTHKYTVIISWNWPMVTYEHLNNNRIWKMFPNVKRHTRIRYIMLIMMTN